MIANKPAALAAAALVFGLALAPSRAFAEGSPAEAAFREGRTLMAAGDLQKACEKFAESQKLEPAAGTLLNLAECQDKRGLSASAWRTYTLASKAAVERGRADWKKLADERAAGLAKVVPHVTFVASKADVAAGLVVEQDGERVPANQQIEVDPGLHRVEATMDGKSTFTSSFTLKNGDDAKVTITPTRPEPLEATTEGPRDGSKQRTIGLVVGGIGVAGLAVGAASGLVAMSAHDDAKSKCTTYPTGCPSDGSGTEANDKAKTFATVSTIGFIAGGVLAAGGAFLFFTAPKRSETGLRVAPVVGQNGTGLFVDGRF
jgi:hypothetical protein